MCNNESSVVFWNTTEYARIFPLENFFTRSLLTCLKDFWPIKGMPTKDCKSVCLCLCVCFYVNETYGGIWWWVEWSNDFLQRKYAFLCFLSFLRFCIWCLTVVVSILCIVQKSITNPFRVSNTLVLCCIQIFVLYYEIMATTRW